MSDKNIPFIKLKPEKVEAATWCAVIEAWENGLSDREAAFRASKVGQHITADDIRQWIKDNPEIGELRANLHDELLSTAKITVAKALKRSDRDGLQTARWYLERKGGNEFSTKQAVAFEGAVVELSLEDKEKKLNEMVEKFERGEQ